jgi:hypothetical protein
MPTTIMAAAMKATRISGTAMIDIAIRISVTPGK